MSVALRYQPRIFVLHVRCENCVRETSRVVEVPPVDDAPCDVDELVESGVLSSLTYCCTQCDCRIGQIIGVSQERSYAT
ncbi:hypothetical protein BKP54_11205 [Ensifer sp. 1H6]|nr:hypothetical protein BKP54_11205 [Ensifer sp. 1H6]OOG74047.1 hypothetical protein B0E45_06035 [Sinorhizobium sp. A49]